MALQPPKYTDAQRAAILHACIDREPPVSVPAACRLAAAGELRTAAGERLDAWNMHQGTARDYVARERRRRAAAVRAAQPVDAAGRALALEVIELAREHVARLKRRRNVPAADITAAAKMTRETLALARTANLEPGEPAAPDGQANTSSADDTGALAAAAAEIAAQGPPPEPSPTGDAENGTREARTQHA